MKSERSMVGGKTQVLWEILMEDIGAHRKEIRKKTPIIWILIMNEQGLTTDGITNLI